MKRLLALSLMLSVAVPAWAEPPADIGESVEALRKKVGAAGVSIAIVEDGKTTLSRGWGVRKIGERAPVDEQTIFQTGSTGKAMTAAALAILVDEGKIAWDDPVIKHMPWFRMYDAWVTREITIRDLLVHRSGLGLGQGDLMFVPRTHLTRKQTAERVAFLKPKTSFRSAYAYDNILYAVAGQLIEEVTGQTWEDFIRARVLRAGGMKNATSDSEDRFRTPTGHGRTRGYRARCAVSARRRRSTSATNSAATAPRRAGSRSAPTTWRRGSRSSSRTARCRMANACSAKSRRPKCGRR